MFCGLIKFFIFILEQSNIPLCLAPAFNIICNLNLLHFSYTPAKFPLITPTTQLSNISAHVILPSQFRLEQEHIPTSSSQMLKQHLTWGKIIKLLLFAFQWNPTRCSIHPFLAWAAPCIFPCLMGGTRSVAMTVSTETSSLIGGKCISGGHVTLTTIMAGWGLGFVPKNNSAGWFHLSLAGSYCIIRRFCAA